MFWRWASEYKFMECEPGEHLSQTEALSQRLFAITFWGDYSGNMFDRYHFEKAQELAPNIVWEARAMYGQGLMLGDIGMAQPGELRALIEFMAFFDDTAEHFGDYPLYDESDFSEWEWKKSEEEMSTGWWAESAQQDMRRALYRITDWETTLIPEKGTEAWDALLYEYMHECDENSGNFEPYWENAVNFYVGGWEAEDVVMWLLTRYAEQK